MKFTCTFFLSIALFLGFAQSDSGYTWTCVSKKLNDKQYQLTFTTTAKPNHQFYAPNQTLGDLKSAELSFADSSITVSDFKTTSPTQQVKSAIFENQNVLLQQNKIEWVATISFKDKIPAQVIGNLTYYYNNADEFISEPPFSFSTNLEGGVSSNSKIKINSIELNKPANNCGDDAAETKSLFTIFILGFLGGLVALITPCVFPLIPVTVTFFTKKATTKKAGLSNAILYGVFIFLIYVFITIPFHLLDNISPEIFNNISTNVWLNLIFFAVFVFFALSFFGLFEINLPSSFANKADSKSGIKNIAGIFFMAGTLAIVSFSCTGPILGTLLANVANGGAWPLTVGAAGFGLALGLPFALFALFPQWLQSLPKSGGWMTDVKVVLGFIELALAIKFLANADNVEQWGILKREVFVAMWFIIGVLTVLYLLGVIRMGHSTPVKKFKPIRIFFIIFFSAFSLYLLPGVFNSVYARLKLLSGFPPPQSYTIYNHHVLLAEKIEPIHNDYEKALALAKEQNKPILIDFTGWACVNCRRMEEKVWTDKEADSLMRKKFVVVSLYVDERTKLPAQEQTVYTTASGAKKNIITVGDKWATFQTENFGATSQPQYAILSPNEKLLTKTKFYTPNAKEFAEWLKCGLGEVRK